MEDDADFFTEVGGRIFTEIDAVKKNATGGGIVQAANQLDERRFPGAILADKCQSFFRFQTEAHVLKYSFSGVSVGEGNALEFEALADGTGAWQAVGGVLNRRFGVKELEQIAHKKRLFRNVGKRGKYVFKCVSRP